MHFLYQNPAQVGTNVKLVYLATNNPAGPCAEAIDSLIVTINDAPEVKAGIDKTVCEGDVVVMSDANFAGSTCTIIWCGGLGSFHPNNTTLNAIYSPLASEIGTTVNLTLTSDDPTGPCLSVSDQVRITIQKAPEVFAGSDKIICEGSSVNMGDATFAGSTTSITWSGGLGSFLPNNSTLNATYIPNPSEYGTTISLTMTSNDPVGPCIAASDNVNLTINIAALVYAGIDKIICEGDLIPLSDATQGGSTTSVSWIGGTGTFSPNRNVLNPTYSPNPLEVGTTVNLILASNDPVGPCPIVTSQVKIIVNKAPEVNAGVDRVICEASTVNLNGSTSGAATNATWATTGDGTFSFIGDLNARYTPGVIDILNGGVILSLTTNNPSGPCDAVSDDVIITN